MNYELVAAVFLVALAFFVFGLWIGERGRRKAAENWAVTGAPDKPEAVSRAPAKQAEDRFNDQMQELEKATVDRGVKEMVEEAKALGLPVDKKKMRKDVEAMISGNNVDGP